VALKAQLIAVAVASVSLTGGAVGGAATRDVAIPARARQTDLADAFAMLHSLGLRVAIDQATPYSSLRPAWVAKLTPRAGTRVPVGTTVTITPNDGPIGSPSFMKSNPHSRVPSFIGKTAATAINWANGHNLYWGVPRLPPLPASDARTLFAAYRVTAQAPAAGKTMGQGLRSIHGSFTPTPLTLTLKG